MIIIQMARDRIFNISWNFIFIYLFVRENWFGKNFNFDKSVEFEVNISLK